MVDSTAQQPAATSAWGSSASSVFMGAPLFPGFGLPSSSAPAASATPAFAAGAQGGPTPGAAAHGMPPGAQPARRLNRRVHRHRASAAAAATSPQPAPAPPPSSSPPAAQLPLRFKHLQTPGPLGGAQAPLAAGTSPEAAFAAAAEGLPQRFAGSVSLGSEAYHKPRADPPANPFVPPSREHPPHLCALQPRGILALSLDNWDAFNLHSDGQAPS